MAKDRIKKRPLLVVEWEDTTSETSWEAEDIDRKPLMCFSVGWQLKSSRGGLVITSMRTEDKKCTDRQVIPRGCIRSIRRIE